MLVINNLEFDHADIYQDLAAIQQQFHYLLRTIQGNGYVIYPDQDANVIELIQQGCWSQMVNYNGLNSQWTAQLLHADGSSFAVYQHNKLMGTVTWSLLGRHNVHNALAAVAAATVVGVDIEVALQALVRFKNVRRRLEYIACIAGITVYEDFAHHPTAIATTLAGLRAKVGSSRIVVCMELGSYTMRYGAHKDTLLASLAAADLVYCRLQQEHDAVQQLLSAAGIQVEFAVAELLASAVPALCPGDHVVIMSNTNFDACKTQLVDALHARYPGSDST